MRGLMETSIPTNYKYLVEDGHYTEDYLEEGFLYWHERCENFISIKTKKMELKSYVRIDEDRLILMVLSYFADIVRLKEFHQNVDVTRRVTTFAYSSYWFLKCGPLQLIELLPPDNKRLNSINELFVATIWISEFVKPLNIKKELSDRYFKELFYFFKYRSYHAQSLEAMLTALLLGANQNPFYDKPKPPLDISTITRAECLAVLKDQNNNPILAGLLKEQIQAYEAKIKRRHQDITLFARNDFEAVAAEAAQTEWCKQKPPTIKIERLE